MKVLKNGLVVGVCLFVVLCCVLGADTSSGLRYRVERLEQRLTKLEREFNKVAVRKGTRASKPLSSTRVKPKGRRCRSRVGGITSLQSFQEAETMMRENTRSKNKLYPHQDQRNRYETLHEGSDVVYKDGKGTIQ